jgi:hypothetical protein
MRNTPFIVATLCGFVACTTQGDDAAGRRRPTYRPDAAAPAIDASTPPSTDAGASSSLPGGTVSCYREGAPDAFCTLPTRCCFTNYSAQHNGSCTSSSCAWGTIECDGPEDCAEGQRCCSRAILDSYGTTVGYRMACSSNACGASPLGEELCHPDGAACRNGGACVTAYGNQTDLPRSLYICR